MELTLESVFKTLVGEADYYDFDKAQSNRASGVSTSQYHTDVSGSGEDHGIDVQRVKRSYDGAVISSLGLGSLSKVSNMLNRDFINAIMYYGEKSYGSRSVRTVWPSKEIIGALDRNPTVPDPDDESKSMKKYEVVGTAKGSTESQTPVFCAINVKVKSKNQGKRRDEHNARGDNQQFAGTWYDSPSDYTADFSDPRFAEKVRGRNGTLGSYMKDSGSVGIGLVPQYSRSGMVFSDKSGTNKTSKITFEADRPLKVADLRRFITRKGASNGIAGHFMFDVTVGGRPYKMSIIELMQKIGSKLADGTFSGDITASANEDIVTNREVVYPEVDNEYFYAMEDVPAPDGSNWVDFLSELAKTSKGFDDANGIFGGLDDGTVYALYAKCAIPVRLSRIYFSKPAFGSNVVRGKAVAMTNVQNKTSTPFAKMIMAVLKKGVSAGKTYALPDGRNMFVFKSEMNEVTFPNTVLKAGKLVEDPNIKPLTLVVNYVGGVIKGKDARDTFFLMPICTPKDGGDTFVFLRYGDSDLGVKDGESPDCTTPENMNGGLMVTVKEPIKSISFVEPGMDSLYNEFAAGYSEVDDVSDTPVDYDNGERVEITADDYVRRYGKGSKEKGASSQTGRGEKTIGKEEIDSIANGEDLDLSASDLAKVANQASIDDDKQKGDWIDFSKPKEVWQKKLREIDAKNKAVSGKPSMTKDEIDSELDDLDRIERESGSQNVPVNVGGTVDGNDGDDLGDETED